MYDRQKMIDLAKTLMGQRGPSGELVKEKLQLSDAGMDRLIEVLTDVFLLDEEMGLENSIALVASLGHCLIHKHQLKAGQEKEISHSERMN